jgi:ribonuclease HI
VTAGEKVHIYTDGSAHNGQVGAAAILKRPGKQRRTLHYHLSTTEEHTVYKAEMVGLLLGLQLIKMEQAGSVPTVIGADNQAALKAIQSELMHPRQHLAAMFLCTASQIKGKCSTKYSLTLRWTAGHVGIPGNEEADTEARKAAEGLTSDTKLLPPTLRRALPKSTTAIKQKHSTQIKSKWVTLWRKSPRGKQMLVIDNTSPSPKFIQAISNPKLGC